MPLHNVAGDPMTTMSPSEFILLVKDSLWFVKHSLDIKVMVSVAGSALLRERTGVSP